MATFPSTAKQTRAFTTYMATGNREDLSNSIYNIDPYDTPVMSAIRRRNVTNRFYDWQTENLPVALQANSQHEGFVNVPDDSTPTIRQQGVAQISKRDATVSGSQEEMDAAGKSSEMAHQMAMIAKVLKSDMEVIMCGRQAKVSGSDATPRQTESIPHWLGRALDRNGNGSNNWGIGGAGTFTSTQLAGGCTVGVIGATGTISGTYPNDSATISGLPSTDTGAMAKPATPVSITEAMVGDAMQKAYTNGASPSILIVPPGPKRTISTFVGRSTTQVLVGKTEVVSTVDVIATDFGRIKVIPSRWVPPDIGLLIDPDYAAVAFFRSFKQTLLAKIGDAENRLLLVEWGIEMRNPLAHVLLNGIQK